MSFHKTFLVWMLFVLVLGGCSAKPTVERNLQAVSHEAMNAEPIEQISDGQQEVQSLKEKQLVLLFQAFLQMDRKESLTFTPKQAVELLPILRKSITEGQIAGTDQKKVLEKLTTAQKQFYDEFVDKVKARIEERKKLDELSPEEREKMIDEFKKQRRKAQEAEAGTGKGEMKAPPHPSGTYPGSSSKNIEKQLIDMLEAKMNK